MKKFRLVLLALSVILIISVLTGCSSNTKVERTCFLSGARNPGNANIQLNGTEKKGIATLFNVQLYNTNGALYAIDNGTYDYTGSGGVYTIKINKDKTFDGTYQITVDGEKLVSKNAKTKIPLEYW